MFCTNCGKKLDEDARFCPYCGARVVENVVSVQNVPKQPVNIPVQQDVNRNTVEQPVINQNFDRNAYEQPVSNQDFNRNAHEQPVSNQNFNRNVYEQPVSNQDFNRNAYEHPVSNQDFNRNAYEQPVINQNFDRNAYEQPVSNQSFQTENSAGASEILPGTAEPNVATEPEMNFKDRNFAVSAEPEKNMSAGFEAESAEQGESIEDVKPAATGGWNEIRLGSNDGLANVAAANNFVQKENETYPAAGFNNNSTSNTEPDVYAIPQVSETYTEVKPEVNGPAPKKDHTKLIIIIAAIIVVVVIAVAGVLIYLNAPEQRLVKAVKEEDYDTAYTILTEETVKETDKTVDAAGMTVKDILDQFCNDDINFDEAFEKLDALEGTPGAYAAEAAADRIETILEDEYEDNFRKLEEVGDLYDVDEATEIITDVRESFDYRSGYRDCDTWSGMIACALEGAAAETARVLITIDEPDELAYEAEYDEYPSTRDEVGRNLVNYAIYLLDDEAGYDSEKNINCDLQETLAYSILDGTAPEDFSAMFEASNYDHMCYGLDSLDVISGTEGSGKVLMAIHSEDDSEYSDEYDIIVDYDDASVMPLDYIPESLADVEYIVLFYFDKEEKDTYVSDTRSIPGYQANGYVSVIHCPTGKTIYTSEKIWGPELKDTYYVYDSDTRIIEDRPDLSVFEDEVLNAIGAGNEL